MKNSTVAKAQGVRRFRQKLLIGMMLVVLVMTGFGLFLAQRKVQIEASLDLQQDFRNELAILHGVQEVRHAALAERCRQLVLRPRIHAALEDNALDLLYPSANDELRDIVDESDDAVPESADHALNATFYRFLDGRGTVISPPNQEEVGELQPNEEAQLSLPSLPDSQQIGYLFRTDASGASVVNEVFAMPIFSTESGELIAALVLGFKPVELGRSRSGTEIRSGIWSNGRLHLPTLSAPEQSAIAAELAGRIATAERSATSFEVNVGAAPHLLFYMQLNPGSAFPPAYEIAVYPLTKAIARQQQIRWHVIIAGAALLALGFLASHFLSRRLSEPVEKLAVTSERNRAERELAEAALETTSEELQRSARFSADASHQLKTPVTVLRAGLDQLLARDDLQPAVYDELSALLHQTYRITSVIDDLLLLSRMDAGRLQIQFATVNLSQLIDEWLDDFSALPDGADIKTETDFPPDVEVAGEKRYIMLILQNLLENARKYNVPGGRICVWAREEGDYVVLSVENTGRPIAPAAREHIFERFHRGGVGENVPGHGLGLNLARELARLHGGDLRLTRSDDEGTEFEARLPVARRPATNTAVAHAAA